MKKTIGIALLLMCIFTAGVWCGQYTSKCDSYNEYKLHSEYCIRCYDSCLDDIEEQKQLLRNCIYVQKENILRCNKVINDVRDSCDIITGLHGEYKVLPMVN